MSPPPSSDRLPAWNISLSLCSAPPHHDANLRDSLSFPGRMPKIVIAFWRVNLRDRDMFQA
eukprot:6611390-Pyramimonas_sp.AAC.1